MLVSDEVRGLKRELVCVRLYERGAVEAVRRFAA
jgi:hypothetical protein